VAFFSSHFSSDDPEEVEARLTEQAARVVLHGRPRYEDTVVGDESFSVARAATSAPVTVEGVPADVVVSYTAEPAPWWSGPAAGDLAKGPVLFDAARELGVRTAAGGVGTTVTFERRRFRALARAYFGPEVPLRLAEAKPERTGAGTLWKQLVEFTRTVPLERPLIRANAYRALAFSVLETFSLVSPRSEAFASARYRAQQFQQAQEYLDVNARRPIGMDDAAIAVDVSVQELRRLFLAFAPEGQSPQHYLRERRLIGAHNDLVQAEPGSTSVRAVAARWGFARPGHFVRLHIERYRQAPHELLK
jgi:AraC-like DNA-binding protein